MSDLDARVDALEAENKELKEQLAALTSRLAALEAGGGGGAKKARPAGSGRPKRPATKKKAPGRKVARGASGKASGKPRKRRGSTGGAEKKSNARGQLEEDPELQARFSRYNVGKAKIGVVVPEEYKDYKENSLPEKDLQLDFVYGYNGSAARANVFHCEQDGCIAYCLAGTGVVHDLKSNTQTHFTGHNEDILCMAKHPTQDIFATGQRDPKGEGTPYLCVWNAQGEELKRITVHERGICAIAFTGDGKYVGSIGEDDDHTFALHEWESKKSAAVSQGPSGKDNAWSMAFNPADEGDTYTAVVLGKSGFRQITAKPSAGKQDKFKTKKISTYGKTKITQKGHLSVSFWKDGDNKGQYIVGCASGHVYKLEGTSLQVFFPAAKRGIGALYATDDGGFITCGEGKVIKWNAEAKSTQEVELGDAKDAARAMSVKGDEVIIGTKRNVLYQVDMASGTKKRIAQGHTDEVWGLAVHPTDDLIVSSGMDSNINIIKTADHQCVQTVELVRNGVRSACFSPDGSYLVCGTHNGSILCFDATQIPMEKKWEVEIAGEQVDCLDFHPNSQKFVAGSWDQRIYQVNAADGKTIKISKGHTSSVLFVNYSGDGEYIISNSRDYEVLFWNSDNGKRVTRFADVADVDFPKWQCFLGWPVQGIWDGASDGTDINAVDKSSDGSCLATGDDFGTVKLFKFPAIAKSAKNKTYTGHSSHVANVRFSADGNWLYSAGGADTGVFQWKVVG